MAKEIERRFLPSVGEDAYDSVVLRLGIATPQAMLIKQGYFEVADPAKSFRVRVRDDFNQLRAFLTIKGGEGLVRDELEKEIDLELGNALLEISHHRIEKMRYLIDGWEIDVFFGPLKGMILLEKEMRSTDESVEMTPFLRSLFDRVEEVTDSLTNLHLARLATDFKGLGASAMPFISENLLRSIPCIGLVGGPGSGKSGVIKALKAEFPDIHFVPEVATIVISDLGISPSSNPILNRRFQRAIYNTAKIFRTTSTEYAISHHKKGLAFDRPEADGAGYFDGGIPEFEEVLGTSIEAELDKVRVAICLKIPSREIYEECKRNNPARTETYEEALAREEKTIAIWQRHRNFHLIDNEGGWDAKVDRVRRLIKETINT